MGGTTGNRQKGGSLVTTRPEPILLLLLLFRDVTPWRLVNSQCGWRQRHRRAGADQTPTKGHPFAQEPFRTERIAGLIRTR
jgi:hypothetical protein